MQVDITNLRRENEEIKNNEENEVKKAMEQFYGRYVSDSNINPCKEHCKFKAKVGRASYTLKWGKNRIK